MSPEELVATHLSFAKRVAEKFCAGMRCRFTRDELEAAALTGLWKAARTFQERECSFKHYASKVVFGAMVDWWRKSSRARSKLHKSGVRFVSLEHDPRDTRTDSREAVEHLIRHLRPRERIVFRFMFLEGYDQYEVADMLGLSQATISNDVKSGLEFLREKHHAGRVH